MPSNPRQAYGMTGPAENLLRTATLQLTNAQIKALPSGPVDIVAAPGASRVLQLIAGWVSSAITTPYETLTDATCLELCYDGGVGASSLVIQDTTGTNAWDHLETLLTASSHVPLVPLALKSTDDTAPVHAPFAAADVENKALQVQARLLTGGPTFDDWTAGADANTLRVTVLYAISDVG